MSNAPRLRVGLIGYGLAGSVFHAPLIEVTPDLELSAVVTSRQDRQDQVRRRHPRARILNHAEDLLARPADLDLVVIASPNRTHVDFARRALLAGLPVVVDKPLAAAAAEGRALAQLAGDRGLLLTVFQSRRWDGDFLTIRRLAETGALGPIWRFESRYERWRPEPRPGWREIGDPAEAGGLLYDLGSHLVDQAVQLLGAVTAVYAEMDRRRAGVEVEDDAFVALHHSSGARSHLWMSAVAATKGPRFRVLGDRAAYLKYGMDPQEEDLRAGLLPVSDEWGREPAERWGMLGAGDHETSVETQPGAYQLFYAGVAAALREGAPPPVEVTDAIGVLALLEAARRSAEEERVVRTGAAEA